MYSLRNLFCMSLKNTMIQFVNVIFVILCFGNFVQSEYGTLLTNEHNRYRRQEGAANMKKMTWSRQLENEAKAWASRCSNGHQGKGRGENIAMLSVGQDISQLVRRGVKMWYDEKRSYSPGMGFQSSTGHYTQVVWADSDQLGCGVQICEPGSGFYMRYMYLVCFYNPQGNFNNREPYVRGPACSRCSGQSCDNGLCSGTSGRRNQNARRTSNNGFNSRRTSANDLNFNNQVDSFSGRRTGSRGRNSRNNIQTPRRNSRNNQNRVWTNDYPYNEEFQENNVPFTNQWNTRNTGGGNDRSWSWSYRWGQQ